MLGARTLLGTNLVLPVGREDGPGGGRQLRGRRSRYVISICKGQMHMQRGAGKVLLEGRR